MCVKPLKWKLYESDCVIRVVIINNCWLELPFLMIYLFIWREGFNWEEWRELEFISTES